jgi:cGMP-dependent 3',5'-cyclic phosphodiesterase
VKESAIQALLSCKDDHDIKDFNEFHFISRDIPDKHTACYTIKMFTNLCFDTNWKIKMSTLARYYYKISNEIHLFSAYNKIFNFVAQLISFFRFILYVKKSYRDAAYHNWMHAFSVAHFAYLLIKNLQLITEKYITSLQALVFLVSCLCHDVDHRGTNNAFQMENSTVLARLYNSENSIMEVR